jgi:hypothetical protein
LPSSSEKSFNSSWFMTVTPSSIILYPNDCDLENVIQYSLRNWNHIL